ncbi:Serine-protein kinase rsbW [Heyndrickxia sporothermodurans]|uniref:Serine-protein kinase RsbW n=1 Tax=Heyndrickxia sporothermodurans TaxID=46224 RepID=A0A150KKN3_9BACI|nr:anti-sigma B factor RsbW [Heyndrickxia sporothermodurans]KYC83959.1 Serine-protein kinase rsbW [Heyndrickxia sporothermodurans]
MVEAFDNIEMKIPAKPEYIGVIRLTLSGIASRMGFGYEMIEDLKIATSEAITNAIQHAYKEDAAGEIFVGFTVFPNRLDVVVADQGRSFDVEKTKSETGPYDENEKVEFMREGGLGLYLIESLMDEVRFHYKKGVTVLMTKYLEGEQVETDARIVST